MSSESRVRSREGEEAVWYVAGRNDVGLLRARYVRQSFPRHTHDCFVVCVNERGAHASWYAGRTVIIPERAIAVVPPGEVHTGYSVPGSPWHYRAMYPSAELIAALASEVGLPAQSTPTFPGLCLSDANLADAFVRTHRQCETTLDPLECEGSVADILMAVLERHATGAKRLVDALPPDRAVARAIEHIQDCYARRITLNGVAEAAGISRYAVLRAFRRMVGIPPYAFVTQVRIEHAKHLLRAGVGIAAVSQRVGFADQSHLTRHFKRLMGVTPGVFARGARAA
jgi:AraC-like DNA-binding protein